MTLDRKNNKDDTMSLKMATHPCPTCGLKIMSKNDAYRVLRRHFLNKKVRRGKQLKGIAKLLQYLQLPIDMAIYWLNQREYQNDLLGLPYKIRDFKIAFKEWTAKNKTRDSYRNLRDYHERIVYATLEVMKEHLQGRHRGALFRDCLAKMAHVSPYGMDRWDTQEFHRNTVDEDLFSFGMVTLHQYCVVTLHHGNIHFHPTLQKAVRYRMRDDEYEERNMLDHLLTYHMGIKVDHRIALWGFASQYKGVLEKHADVPAAVLHLLIKANRICDALLFADMSLRQLMALPQPPVEGLRAAFLRFGDILDRITEAPARWAKSQRRADQLDLPWMLEGVDKIASRNYYGLWENTFPVYGDEEEVAQKVLLCSENLEIQIGTTPCTRENVERALELLEDAFSAGILEGEEYVLLKTECESCFRMMCKDFEPALKSFQELSTALKYGAPRRHLRTKINVFHCLKKLGMEKEASLELSEIMDGLSGLRCDQHAGDFGKVTRKLADLLFHLGHDQEALDLYRDLSDFHKDWDEKHKEETKLLMLKPDPYERFKLLVKKYAGSMEDRNYWDRVRRAKIQRAMKNRMNDRRRNKRRRKISRWLENRRDLAYLLLKSGQAGEARDLLKLVHERYKSTFPPELRPPFEVEAMIGYCAFSEGKYQEALEILKGAVGNLPWNRTPPSRIYPIRTKEDCLKEQVMELAIAKCHAQLGDVVDAVKTMESIEMRLAAILLPDHPHLLATRKELDKWRHLVGEKELIPSEVEEKVGCGFEHEVVFEFDFGDESTFS